MRTYPEAKRITREVVVVVEAGNTYGEVTLVGVPIGHYTVTEGADWSWRYTEDNSKLTAVKYAEATPDVTADALTDKAAHLVQVDGSMVTKVTFTDDLTNRNWLSGTAYAQNRFGSNAGGNNSAALPVDAAPVALLPTTEEDDKKKRPEA